MNCKQEGPFAFITKKQKCQHCKKQIKSNTGAHLQCSHSLHFECIKQMAIDKFGEYMDVIIIDKTKIFPELLKKSTFDEFYKMTFATENCDNLIECPKCQLVFSLTSPIRRIYAIPKMVEKIITFEKEDSSLLNYHLSSNIDTIHLLKIKDQRKILSEFNPVKENEYITDDIISRNPHISDLNNNAIMFHAVKNNDKLCFCPYNECLVCIKQDVNSVHCTLDDLMNLLK